jgi:hypothetical protein
MLAGIDGDIEPVAPVTPETLLRNRTCGAPAVVGPSLSTAVSLRGKLPEGLCFGGVPDFPDGLATARNVRVGRTFLGDIEQKGKRDDYNGLQHEIQQNQPDIIPNVYHERRRQTTLHAFTATARRTSSSSR